MNSSLFNFRDYKEFLRNLVHSKGSPRGLQSQLARHLGCQASYLYQVLKGKAELTEDQAFKVTSFLRFKSSERDYFLTLVRMSKAGTAELKAFLKGEIDRLHDAGMDLRNHSDSEVPMENDELWDFYFSGELPALIHVMTSSKNFQTSESLARRLNVPSRVVTSCLQRLAFFGLVTNLNGKWQHSSPSLHLPKDSRYNSLMQLQRRTQAAGSILMPSTKSVHFSSLFTLDPGSFEKLRSILANLVEKAQKLVHEGGTDDAYMLCLDLFEPHRN